MNGGNLIVCTNIRAVDCKMSRTYSDKCHACFVNDYAVFNDPKIGFYI